MDISKGAIWVAWGQSYVDEAVRSAASFRKMNDIPCLLISDTPPNPDHPFNDVWIEALVGSYRDKIIMGRSPFKKTIFFDTDTLIFQPFDELYRALDRFDVAVQPAIGGFHYQLQGVPLEVFPEPSAGLIAWKRTGETDAMFSRWALAYDQQQRDNGNGAWDQRSLRQALWDSNVSLLFLTTNWQVVSFQANYILGQPIMLHGRQKSLEFAIKHLFQSKEYRIFIPKLGAFALESELNAYLKLAACAITVWTRKILRRLLHHLRIWRLPASNRSM